jgi:hypothetical protein
MLVHHIWHQDMSIHTSEKDALTDPYLAVH